VSTQIQGTYDEVFDALKREMRQNLEGSYRVVCCRIEGVGQKELKSMCVKSKGRRADCAATWHHVAPRPLARDRQHREVVTKAAVSNQQHVARSPVCLQ
jgi:hypothetical protein